MHQLGTQHSNMSLWGSFQTTSCHFLSPIYLQTYHQMHSVQHQKSTYSFKVTRLCKSLKSIVSSETQGNHLNINHCKKEKANYILTPYNGTEYTLLFQKGRKGFSKETLDQLKQKPIRANSKSYISLSNVEWIFMSPIAFSFVGCHTLLSCRLVQDPVCSTSWQESTALAPPTS